jgi:hypothetical protein
MEIFVVSNGILKWNGYTIGHTTKISIAVLTIFYYAQQFLKIHMHILY